MIKDRNLDQHKDVKNLENRTNEDKMKLISLYI